MPGKSRVQVPNYVFLTHDRADVHRNAKVSSGGVGVLIHDKVLAKYRIDELVYICDGQLGVIIKHRTEDYKIGLVVGYISPESSKYGRDPDEFFEYLTRFVYDYNECDKIYIGGDYNARTGKLLDYIPDVDDLPGRSFIDLTKNKHGECLIDCLKGIRYGLINSRITPEYDNFTSISSKGTAVVDYVFTKYEDIANVIECKTLSVNCIIDEIRGEHPDFNPATLSDHSLILITCREDEDFEIRQISEDPTTLKGKEKPSKQFPSGPVLGHNW